MKARLDNAASDRCWIAFNTYTGNGYSATSPEFSILNEYNQDVIGLYASDNRRYWPDNNYIRSMGQIEECRVAKATSRCRRCMPHWSDHGDVLNADTIGTSSLAPDQRSVFEYHWIWCCTIKSVSADKLKLCVRILIHVVHNRSIVNKMRLGVYDECPGQGNGVR